MALKHYVEFFFPGAIVSDTSTEEVKDRDPTKIQKKFAKTRGGQFSRPPMAFQFFDVEVVTSPDSNEELRGKPKNYSGRFWLGVGDGKTYTIAELETLAPKRGRERMLHGISGPVITQILLDNAHCNGWTRFVETNGMNLQPLAANDVVLASE